MDPVSLLSPHLDGSGEDCGMPVGSDRGAGNSHLAGRSPAGERHHLQSSTIHVCNMYQSSITPHHATVKCYNWICV